MQDLDFDVDRKYINNKNEKISFPIEININLQQAMNKFVEDHPNMDQYKIIQRAIAGFLIEKGFQNRELIREFLGGKYFQ
tara:strand:- start:181 stop:420 length:240 start_codon:yes stop_codon:yes gene_type:complete